MTFTSPAAWLLFAAAILGGWLIGAATSPEGRKWKRRFDEREIITAKYRREMEKALVKARERIRQLESERDGNGTEAAAPPATDG